jgi:hypothetical protein
MWYNIKVYRVQALEQYVSNVQTHSSQAHPFGPITHTVVKIEFTDKYCNAWVNMVPAELDAVKAYLKAQEEVIGLWVEERRQLDEIETGRAVNVFSKGFNTFEV